MTPKPRKQSTPSMVGTLTGKRLMLMKRVRTVTAAVVLQTVAVALEDLAGRNHQ